MDPTIGVDALGGADGALGYALVFLLAAIPVVEVLVVVPAAIALGLNPALVVRAAFAGTLTTVLLVIVGSDRALAVVRRRFGDPGDDPSKRVRRAKRLWRRYGTAGLALAAPISTGAHLAAVLALSPSSSVSGSSNASRATVRRWTSSAPSTIRNRRTFS